MLRAEPVTYSFNWLTEYSADPRRGLSEVNVFASYVL